ncbi:hypothetical protein H2203_000782 [Taxawa tesnikishii (nom. ined.)]|nr:hypothetical protein H2203_000782 [Dothideales sp. JES 119]
MSPAEPSLDWAPFVCTLSLHDDGFSHESVVFSPAQLASRSLKPGGPARIIALKASVSVQDFQTKDAIKANPSQQSVAEDESDAPASRRKERRRKGEPDYNPNYLDFSKSLVFVGRTITTEQKASNRLYR